MRTCWCLHATAVAGLLLAGMAATAQDKGNSAGHAATDKPGAAHKELARLAGEYSTVARFRAGAGAPAQESHGTATLVSTLGGRFVREENAGTFMGQPTSGVRLIGYNNAAGRYEAVWVYTGSTALMTLTGTSKDGGKTIDWVATFERDKDAKMTLSVVTRVVDDDHFVVELSARTPDGGKGPTLETTYTRKK
jgi:hypothetical protein